MNTFSQFQVLSSRAERVFNWPPLHHVTRFTCECFFGFLSWLKGPDSPAPRGLRSRSERLCSLSRVGVSFLPVTRP